MKSFCFFREVSKTTHWFSSRWLSAKSAVWLLLAYSQLRILRSPDIGHEYTNKKSRHRRARLQMLV